MGCSALRQGLRGAGLGKHAVQSAAFAWFGIRRESFRGFCGFCGKRLSLLSDLFLQERVDGSNAAVVLTVGEVFG
jgi:hypothetical protein